MAQRNIHLKFDKILMENKIIRSHIDTNIVHDKMDGTRGRYHQYLDLNHRPLNIKEDLKGGKSLKNPKNMIEKIRIHLENRRMDTRTKNEYLKIAHGHELLDELWGKHNDKHGRYPADIPRFLDKCLMTFKYRDCDHKRI